LSGRTAIPRQNPTKADTLVLVEAGQLAQRVRDPAMISHLCQVNGERGLAEIAGECAPDPDALRKSVSEFLEPGILARIRHQ